MSKPPDYPNPYDSPQYGQHGPPPMQLDPPRPASGLPVFCTVVFILDLVFCFIRLPLVGLGLMGLQTGVNDPMIAQTGLLEVAAGAAIVLFGIPANIAMLVKQKWGRLPAWCCAIATLGSAGVGFWQLSFFLERFPPGSAEYAGCMIGGIVAGGIRLALLGLYVAALIAFARWTATRSPASPHSTQMY